MVISTIEGRSNGELRVVRQWVCRVYQFEDDCSETEIGHTRLYTAPDLDDTALDDCDSISGDLEAVMGTISENKDLWGPVLIIDKVFVKEELRGRGLASVVMQQALNWFGGLVNLAAVVVTQKPEFRPAAARLVEKLGFEQVDGDVWILDLPM